MESLRYLCISDTHLGEIASLLNHKEGLDCFDEFMSQTIAPNGVKKIILLGDITDAVLASDTEFGPSTQNFIRILHKHLVDDGKIVFLFGNHDLRIFRDYICGGAGLSKYFVHGLGAEGNPDVGKIKKIVCPNDIDVPFEVANPFYIEQTDKKVYLFHHGHHLRCDIHTLWWQFQQWNELSLIKKVTGNDIEFGRPSPKKAETLRDFENSTYPFVTTFWWNEQNMSEPPEERFWRWIHKITKYIKSPKSVDAGCRPLSHKDLGDIKKRDVELICKKYLPALIESDLTNVPNNKSITFVYGDTHDGGIKDKTVSDRKVRIVNTGGWVTYNEKRHPRCLVFTVDNAEREKVYECGFDKSYVKKCAQSMKKIIPPKNLSKVQLKMIKMLASFIDN